MPAKSKAQQRLFGAAEHGAQFPMAKQLRATMTHEQLHDFAAGSEQGKPQHMRPLHPKMAQRAQMTREAHAHLKAHVPAYHRASPQQKLLMGNRHVAARLGKMK